MLTMHNFWARIKIVVVVVYLIRKREHAKYPSVSRSRLAYYTLVLQFKDTEAIINNNIISVE